ncbi:hypothetical protein [Gemmata sp.]|uniref:hypothetical protein n=1 Tax=Gemmata sp. TaxID=1914242 RepID=UPI003F72D8AF
MHSRTRTRRAGGGLAALVLLVPLGLAGCSGGDKGPGPDPAGEGKGAAKAPPAAHAAEVRAEREKLSPEDRALVDAQEWCAINTTERLGSMGPPLKVVVNDQPVFICCKGCRKKALADPDKTLATAADLKAEAKAEKDKK